MRLSLPRITDVHITGPVVQTAVATNTSNTAKANTHHARMFRGSQPESGNPPMPERHLTSASILLLLILGTT